ncbi:MAG: hypothetical protein Q8N55_01790 [bacterium]|nr:hypothetical protein [bacterium]
MIRKQNHRQKRQRQKQNLLKKKFLFLSFLGFVLVSGLGYLLFLSPFFKIKQVSAFAPASTISQAKEIAQKLESLEGKSLLFLNTKDITQEFLKMSPEFEAVYFKRNFKNHSLVFTYKLRTPSLILCQKQEENCCLADNNGSLFACNEQFSFWDKADLALLLGDNKQITASYIKDIAFLKASLENGLGLKIAFLKSGEAPQTIEVATTEGWLIYFSGNNDLSFSLTKLKLLLEEKITEEERANLEYIDLRFSKAYYK